MIKAVRKGGLMTKGFSYNITLHPEEEFKNLVYFCSGTGECNLEHVSGDQLSILNNTLNEMGSQGWELVQLNYGKGGVIAFWKKES